MLSSDSLVVTSGDIQQRIALVAIDTIWVRKAYTGRGALIGAGVGATALTALGILFVIGLCDSTTDCSDDYPEVVVLGVAAGGGVGALLGAGVGALASRWVRRYP